VTEERTNSESKTESHNAAICIVPSEHAIRELAGRSAFTFNGIAKSILRMNIASYSPPSAAARRLRLHQLLDKLRRGKKLAYFRGVLESRGFIEGAAGFLDEAQSAGLNSTLLKGTAGGARATKLKSCADLLAAWQKEATEFASPLIAATKLVEQGLPKNLKGVDRIRVLGFNDFSLLQWQFLEALSRHIELEIELPAMDASRPTAFAAVAKTRERLGELANVSIVDGARGDVESRPAGLAHLDRHLFGPGTSPSDSATGLRFLEAPGALGEARLVARRIRVLLADGVAADRIVVTARNVFPMMELLGEVFDEYAIPVELDGDERLLRNPAVRTLLQSLRLPREGWPFAGVTALLRSSYFRPHWPEGDGEMARRAEGLLRLLGEPRGRDAYLRSIDLWARKPPEALEDEAAEESRRKKKTNLAVRCEPFLKRFLAAWDAMPAGGKAEAFFAWAREFALDMGLEAVAAEDARDRAALEKLWAAAESNSDRVLTATTFLAELTTIASAEGIERSDRGAGRVRVVSPGDARQIDSDYLFVLGLGERSFPRLSPLPSLLDDADRSVLRQSGLPFPDPAERLGAEQLLFLQLVARPRRELILSYPAVDERGQPLLPGSFLRVVRDMFVPAAIVPEHQRMLIEGYLTHEPLSAAEARVQFAAGMAKTKDASASHHPNVPADLIAHLGRAKRVATARFHSKDYNRYDGGLENPAARKVIAERFGPAKVFSPTALESYVSCPFRFFMEQILRLEELEDPSEEVEQTRRGSAYHRALARLHRRLRDDDPTMTEAALPDRIGNELRMELDVAVAEYAVRASSPAGKRLWELEGKRLHRSAAKYRDHWHGFLKPWHAGGTHPLPQLLEADFGLPAAASVQSVATADESVPLIISVGGIEVRIGGRIDRVDVAELDDGLGFWVIDYKTGRAANYTGKAIEQMEKLQLVLYALAVEKVLFPGRPARPLGLAYWLVTDTGPKAVMPQKQPLAWLSDSKQWAKFRAQLEAWVAKVVGSIRQGRFPLAPKSVNCTDTCPFGQVCRIAQSRNVGKVWDLAPIRGGDAQD
jgi:ATP-dependent helicase/nuclease subunit B